MPVLVWIFLPHNLPAAPLFLLPLAPLHACVWDPQLQQSTAGVINDLSYLWNTFTEAQKSRGHVSSYFTSAQQLVSVDGVCEFS